MEKKWVFYKIICLVEFMVSIGLCLLLFQKQLFNFTHDKSFFKNLEYLDIIAILSFGIFAIYYYLCLNLIFKKFPDKEISNRYENIFLLTFILTLILFAIILIVLIYGLVETINEKDLANNDKMETYIGLSICSVILLGHFYCMKKSNELKTLITFNFKLTEQTNINSIGS